MIKLFLKISQYSYEKTCVGVSFNKVPGLQIFKNTYIEENLRTADSWFFAMKTLSSNNYYAAVSFEPPFSYQNLIAQLSPAISK